MIQSITASVALSAVIAAREDSTPDQIALSDELARDIASSMEGNTMSAAHGGSHLEIAPRLLRLAFDPAFHRDAVINEELRRTCAYVCFDMDKDPDEQGSLFKAHFHMLLALAETTDMRSAIHRSIDAIELPAEPHRGGTPVQSLNTPAGVASISRDDAHKPASYSVSLQSYTGKSTPQQQIHATEGSAKTALKAMCG